MRRLIFINKVGKNENKYIVGSGVNSQSRFVRSALKKNSSNNSQGDCCDLINNNTINDAAVSIIENNYIAPTATIINEICITPISIINFVSSNGNKYVFNNSSTYNPYIRYSLNNGYYEFTNISSSHPMALLNNGKTNLIIYTGDPSKKLTRALTGTTADGTYDFYYGTINVYVYGDFTNLSVYCYYHGYMGGENLLTYKNSCPSNPINIPTMTITSDTVNDGDTSNHASISLTFTSSVATSNFIEGDITVTNGLISNFAGSGTTYTATFTPTTAGATTINVGAGVYTDAVGNNNIAASEFNWFYSLPSTQTYSINVVGYNYYYDLNGSDRGGIVSGNDARVDLNTGDNVNFNVSMNSGNHPFFIKNSSNNNVTLDSGTQGTINSTLSWTPSVSGTYYYICGAHSSMRGDIIVS